MNQYDTFLRIAGEDPASPKNFREAYREAYADIRAFEQNGVRVIEHAGFCRSQFLHVFGMNRQNRCAWGFAFDSFVSRNKPDTYHNPFAVPKPAPNLKGKKNKHGKRKQDTLAAGI